jgi:hypothetical protein
LSWVRPSRSCSAYPGYGGSSDDTGGISGPAYNSCVSPRNRVSYEH